MKIFVASTSVHKLEPVNKGAIEVFSGLGISVDGRKAASEVNEQPEGYEETLLGAFNRLKNLRNIIKGTRYDLLVAFENGIIPMKIQKQLRWFDLGYVVVENEHGNQSIAHSPGVEFNIVDVEEAKRRGFDRTTVGAVMAERLGIDPADPHAYLTSGIVPRSEMLRQSFKSALGNLINQSNKI